MSMVLSVTGASKRFGANQALDGAALQLARGEWLALLGPNGAGKTTLIRAVAGRVRLDQGRMELLGQDLASAVRDVRSALGVVPQEIALYPLLTARENLQVFGRLHGVARQDLKERIESALEWTQLDERANELVRSYSGGMKRRLNIACGVLQRPSVLLLDEPTVGVDPQSRERIWEMLDELRRQGTSLLLTTHQLDEAQQVSDRIVIIDHGKMIAAGSFEELVKQTIGMQQRLILTFDGEVPMSLDGKGFEFRPGEVRCQVRDIVADLPVILRRLADLGLEVRDLRIETPTLQAVFLHLTGRELRE